MLNFLLKKWVARYNIVKTTRQYALFCHFKCQGQGVKKLAIIGRFSHIIFLVQARRKQLQIGGGTHKFFYRLGGGGGTHNFF